MASDYVDIQKCRPSPTLAGRSRCLSPTQLGPKLPLKDLIRPLKGLIGPFKALIRPFKGLIRPFKGLIRPGLRDCVMVLLKGV